MVNTIIEQAIQAEIRNDNPKLLSEEKKQIVRDKSLQDVDAELEQLLARQKIGRAHV